MNPQYLAPRTSCDVAFDAAQSQARNSISVSYLLKTPWRSFPRGYTQVADPQNARRNRRLSGQPRVEKRDRRLTCLRASRSFAQPLCLPSWQHVAAQTTQVTLKNSWSWTRFRLPLSRRSRANTTKVVRLITGQAVAPVPAHAALFGGQA